MLVYCTSYFNEQVEIQGIKEHIERICQELEQMNLKEVQSRFERVYPYLKRKEGNLRLIARLRRFGKDYVLCWLTIFRRGDSDYEQFLLKRELGHQNLDDIDATIKQWLEEQKVSFKTQDTNLLTLNNDLHIWLERPNWEIDNHGVVIYESQTWLDRFKTAKIQQHSVIYSELISKIADVGGNLGKNTNWPNIKLYGENELYLLFSPIITADSPPRQILFLLAPFIQHPTTKELQQVVNHLRTLKLENKLFTANKNKQNGYKSSLNTEFIWDDLTSLARRAYPSYLLADENLWLTIESDEFTNIALSAEEEAILHQVSTSNSSLPLFLNGRAGSGKSTLLFHLFADYCHRHLRYCRQHNFDYDSKPLPLFLAYNEPVSKNAQERVMRLLESHHRFLAKRGQLETVPDLSHFFQPFRLFLINLLPISEIENFPENKYVSFYYFRKLMKQVWPDYSAERSWLVIRTFIKGYYLDERDTYNDLNDYQEIPKKERTVSLAEFTSIYNNVWKWYDKYSQEEGLWDDQDLIRIILKNKYYRPEYSAIFCDEAQDFTRLELQLIMRLSIFGRYDLEHQYVKSLPFAFAGDPLQTLNPTGFRWSALKSAFYNEIITALAPTGKLNLEMNFVELECNYRSIESIVGVTNLIQLWRKKLCNISEIKPQQARKFGDFKPQKFILDFNIQPEIIKYLLQDTVIIIPCDEGEEIDYIKSDNLLSNFINENYKKDPWNILSAISVKGLEFEQVILYKFGEACSPDLWNNNSHPSEENKYFLNKLYVAASRATERLFIIDTKLGDDILWQHAISEEELEIFIEKLPQEQEKKEWKELICLIDWGNNPQEIANNNLLAIAKTFEVEGLNSANPDLLRRAQSVYQRLNNEEKSIVCEAQALKLERNLSAAGKLLLTQEKIQDAWECFWQDCNWEKLVELYENNEEQIVDNYARKVKPLVYFMSWYIKDNQSTKINGQLKEFTQLMNQESYHINNYLHHQQWQMAIDAYTQIVTNLINSEDNFPADELKKIGYLLLNIAHVASLPVRQIAQSCIFLANQHQTNINYLNQSEIITQELEKLINNQKYDRIIELWEEGGKSQEINWLKYVIPAFEAKECYKQAFIGYCLLDNYLKVKECFEQATNGNTTIKPLIILLKYYIHNQHWKDLLLTLNKYLPVLESVEAENTGLKYDIIYEIACSQLKPEYLSGREKENLEKIIIQHLITNYNWQKYLFIEHFGIALEKIGSLQAILKFYEHYINSEENKIKEFSRYRWLATKYKQENIFRKQVKISQLQKTHLQLAKQAEKWKINLDLIDKEIPIAPQNRPELVAGQIIGLPQKTLVKTIDTISEFEINNLQIQLYSLIKELTIKDTLSNKEIRINGKTKEITIDTTIIKASGNHYLTFSEPMRGYEGKLISFGHNALLEIRFQNLSEIIKIFI